jgi:hypothetical protein
VFLVDENDVRSVDKAAGLNPLPPRFEVDPSSPSHLRHYQVVIVSRPGKDFDARALANAHREGEVRTSNNQVLWIAPETQLAKGRATS